MVEGITLVHNRQIALRDGIRFRGLAPGFANQSDTLPVCHFAHRLRKTVVIDPLVQRCLFEDAQALLTN